MKRLFWLIPFLLVACDVFTVPEPDENLRRQHIFSVIESEAIDFPIVYDRHSVGDYWTVSQADVDKLNDALFTYLQAEGEDNIVNDFDSYYQQFFGFAINDERFIYGNYFCRESEMLREDIVIVLDGGDCYFQVVYDVANDAIVQLMVNGDA